LSEDTIVALASPPGIGALGIIRVSGPATVEICDRIFRGKQVPSQARDRTALLGEVVSRDGFPIDQVLLTVMRAPHSLTGEDVAEITCHGGAMAPRLVLRRLLCEGARAAEPGEFTKRAFLNGKMDLTQAEAVSDIIRATSEKALGVAVRQLRGELSRRFYGIEQRLLDWLAAIEANIDFVDEEIEAVDNRRLAADLAEIGSQLDLLLEDHEQGRYIKDGLDVAIVGKPNVGKSSLFNRLIGKDRVIVSDQPGTTRDVVDGLVGVNGLMLRLHDTAGVRQVPDPVGAEAVRRTRLAVEEADIALIVLDLSTPLSSKDLDIVEEVAAKPHLVVANKTDLPERAAVEALGPAVRVSALKGWGLGGLLDEIRKIAHAQVDDLSFEVIVSERHAVSIREAREAVSRAGASLRDDVPLEFTATDIRLALDSIGAITGNTASTRVLDEIFSRFCVGK
jgi:tRNA modification GTPase